LGWLVLAPMNNTDQDVTIKLRPNWRALPVLAPARWRLRDIYRAFDFSWTAPPGWMPNEGAILPVRFNILGKDEHFDADGDVVTVTVPARSFRLLLMEPAGN
ncbi:MAG: hypothetical protein IT440_07115, partial [Phycisphaeraceae bacterium]|nr:hypothetical protein [Phycisphaeraceae bacterium]